MAIWVLDLVNMYDEMLSFPSGVRGKIDISLGFFV
jgi:hypothetical protein